MAFRDRYCIVGLGLVVGPQPCSVRALTAEAARLAIEDAGLERRDIGGAVELRTVPGLGEVPTLSDAYPRVLGLPVSFYYPTGRGGALASLGVATAATFLETGQADYIVLAGGFDDWSRSRAKKQAGGAGRELRFKSGHWGPPFGDLVAVSHHTFLANRHMYEHGTTHEQLGAIAVAARAWANLNPLAKLYGKPLDLKGYLASPYVVEPYRLCDLCVQTDGAVAFVLTTSERARDLRHPPVYVMVVGFGEAMQRLWWEKGNYTRLAVDTAKATAFRLAGIGLDAVDVAQLYDCFTGEVLFQLEDYGWCTKGEGGPFAAEGHIGPGGDVPVNTGGGLLCAYHYCDLTGLSEAVLQLRGAAGERQVAGAEVALVSGHGGEILAPGMCSIHSTLLLRR